MSKVRLLVGTKKGAFVMTSDGTRDDWDVQGPLFTGWEIYHLKGSPADPDRVYASQSTGWHGQVMQRSDDGGKSWEAVGNEFAYDGVPGTHQWYDGTQHPWEFARVWHLEPSLSDPDTVYAGVEDAALFRSTDGGQSWQELSGLRKHPSGEHWQPGAGGLCLHTILINPDDPNRIVIANRPAQDRVLLLQRVEDRALRQGLRGVEGDLAVDARKSPQMVRKNDADHGRVCASTDSTGGRSCTIAVQLSPPSGEA